MPVSYGSRQAAPAGPAESRPERSATSREDAGEERGRRRRRRSRGTGSRSSGDSQPSRREPTNRSRRESRRDAGESRSRRDRGPRADFSPVSSRYDEDDEGLEFLGVEEAVREGPQRPRSDDTDDVLEESGLGTVLDVPSWVEAIGIVIAGNLGARNKSNGKSDRSR